MIAGYKTIESIKEKCWLELSGLVAPSEQMSKFFIQNLESLLRISINLTTILKVFRS